MARRRRRSSQPKWTPADELGKFYVTSVNDFDDGVCETEQEAIDYATNEWLDESQTHILVMKVVKVIRRQQVIAEAKEQKPEAVKA